MTSTCAVAERHSVRLEVDRLVYVELPDERAFMLNVSDRGMAIQAMNILQPGSNFDFSILVPEVKDRMRASGRIVWSDRSGRAGVQFTDTFDLSRLSHVVH